MVVVEEVMPIWVVEKAFRHIDLHDGTADSFSRFLCSDVVMVEETMKARKEIAEICEGKFRVCLSQGINVRLIDAEAAAALATIEYRDTKFQERRLYTAWDNLKDEDIFFKGVDLLEAAGVPPNHLMAYMLCGYDKAETWDRIWRRFHKMTERGIAPYPMVFDKARKDLVAFQRWVVTGLYRVVPWNEYERETKSPESTAAFARAVERAAL